MKTVLEELANPTNLFIGRMFMNTQEYLFEQQFNDFLMDLCAHMRVAGGLGIPEEMKERTIEEVYKLLRPNGIILGFRNTRMREPYQLSYQMRSACVE